MSLLKNNYLQLNLFVKIVTYKNKRINIDRNENLLQFNLNSSNLNKIK